MKTALVVLSFRNSARTLQRCLASLQNQDYSAYKVVIVDAGSTDGSARIAFSFANDKRFYVFNIPGCTEAQGQNWIIENFFADVVLFTNSDIYVQPNWVSLHMAWHEKGYDMVGGKFFSGGDKYGFTWSYKTPAQAWGVLTQGLSIGFSNCSVTKEMIDKVGPLKVMVAQHDMDFFLRCIKQGARIALDPRLEVYHDHPYHSFYRTFIKSYRYSVNHIVLLRTFFGRRRWPLYPMFPYSKTIMREFFLLHGLETFQQQYPIAEQEGIKTNPIWFLFVRFFGTKFGANLGNLRGMLMLHPSYDKIQDVRR